MKYTSNIYAQLLHYLLFYMKPDIISIYFITNPQYIDPFTLNYLIDLVHMAFSFHNFNVARKQQNIQAAGVESIFQVGI